MLPSIQSELEITLKYQVKYFLNKIDYNLLADKSMRSLSKMKAFNIKEIDVSKNI
jgi:hypothetical protein